MVLHPTCLEGTALWVSGKGDHVAIAHHICFISWGPPVYLLLMTHNLPAPSHPTSLFFPRWLKLDVRTEQILPRTPWLAVSCCESSSQHIPVISRTLYLILITICISTGVCGSKMLSYIPLSHIDDKCKLWPLNHMTSHPIPSSGRASRKQLVSLVCPALRRY